MKNLLKCFLLPALCAFFLLQAQQVAAQSKDNDVLVMEVGHFLPISKTNGMYIYWPDKAVEFIPMQTAVNNEDLIANQTIIYKKINELTDLGWELGILDNHPPFISYYFKRATPK